MLPNSADEFVGNIATDDIREKYVGKMFTNLFPQGNQNPIKYVWGKVKTKWKFIISVKGDLGNGFFCRLCFKRINGNRTARLNRELTAIHHEVIENPESIHEALLKMNRSIQA